jgi:hypothetical protein
VLVIVFINKQLKLLGKIAQLDNSLTDGTASTLPTKVSKDSESAALTQWKRPLEHQLFEHGKTLVSQLQLFLAC